MIRQGYSFDNHKVIYFIACDWCGREERENDAKRWRSGGWGKGKGGLHYCSTKCLADYGTNLNTIEMLEHDSNSD